MLIIYEGFAPAAGPFPRCFCSPGSLESHWSRRVLGAQAKAAAAAAAAAADAARHDVECDGWGSKMEPKKFQNGTPDVQN